MSSSADSPEVHELVIIKHRRDHEEEAHHGGVWKIAYADFMTAMMAFFLVLWLLNSTNKEAKISIKNYFNPIKLSDASMTRKGIIDQKDAQPAAAPVAGKKSKTDEPGDKHGDNGLFPPSNLPDEKSATPPKEVKDKEGSEATPVPEPQPGKPEQGTFAPELKAAPYSEAALFKDPYKVLAEIAAKPEPAAQTVPPPPPAASAPLSDAPAVYRDPFELSSPPLGPQPAQAPAPAGAVPAAKPAASPPAPPPPAPTLAQPPAPARAAGPDDTGTGSAAVQSEAAKLQTDMAKALKDITAGQPAPKVEVQATSEGVLISLTDEFDFGMFAIGSAEPQPKLVKIMEKIAQLLKTRPGPIVIRGHTDGRAYKSGVYDNWRLSSDRAQMARYMLIRGGLDDKRFEAVEGYADRHLKVTTDPSAAENRRIEILLRKEKP